MKNETSNTITPGAVISVSPITLISSAGRGENLQVRVSAPVKGSQLPIIVFAHGYGSSLDGYAPLINYWAAQGFVVIQCTFLDSRRLGLSPEDPRTPLIWKYRVEDIKHILDEIDYIEDAVLGLTGRTDRSRIAAVGHSFGAQTIGMLLGARIINPDGNLGDDMSDSRIKAGVLLTPAGNGGSDLSSFAAEHFTFMNPDYTTMITPALIVAGDKDDSPLTVRGWDWFTDAYTLSPAPKSLLTFFDAEHGLGGISGYEAAETTDENPERVAVLRELTLAYLQSILYTQDTSWTAATNKLRVNSKPMGAIENK